MGRKQKPRQKQRQKPNRKPKGAKASAPRARFDPFGPVPSEKVLPPVFLDGHGHLLGDPWTALGLSPGTSDEEGIRAAYRERLLESPPEQDPDRARLIREARDHLLDPDRGLERLAGTLALPDPAAWGLEGGATESVGQLLPARQRLAAQAVLHVIAEDLLLAEAAAAEGRVPTRGEQCKLY